MKFLKTFLIIVGALLITSPIYAQTITGAGATFPFPIYAKWAEEYNKQKNIIVNYQSIGSGGGIRQIKSKTVDFGATDAPLTSDDLSKSDLKQFPTVIGGVVPVVNISGISINLRFTGDIISEIYLGSIKKWNDPKIQELNPTVKLPDANITVVYRSDGSGTTYVWTEYLSLISETWNKTIGKNTSVSWPVGIGGKGNEGVSASVKQINNSIGYVEYAYAKQNKLNYGLIKNKAGNFVQPGIESFQAAAEKSNWDSVPGFGISLNNQSTAGAWPIVSATFILVANKPTNVTNAKVTYDFFNWVYDNGDKLAIDLDYAPLPKDLKNKIKNILN